MNIKFRNIKKQDTENMIQMAAEIGYEVRYENFSEMIDKAIKNKNITIITATNEENRIVGWIQVEMSNFIFSDKTCNILGLFIDKNYRGRNLGRKLIKKAEDWAKEKECPVLKICSDITRIDSHAFYKHMGFKQIKTQQIFFKTIENNGQKEEIKK